jgi:hypothetical protein
MINKQQYQDDSQSDETLVRIQSKEHHSYLLRLWRSGAEATWRASLQSVSTSERHMFADLESLFAFLCTQLHSFPDE